MTDATLTTAPPPPPEPAPPPPPQPPRRSLLARIGLDRPELRAWAMYDWANSAMVLTIMTAVFPIYYVTVAGEGFSEAAANGRLALCNSIAKIIPALLSPILGAIADARANRKRMLGTWMGLGVTAVVGLWFVHSGDIALASLLFVIASVAVSVSFVFYESLLPHIASDEEMDRVSTAGYALGYIGSGILLALNLLWISKPQWFGMADASVASRFSFVSVGLWWLVFSIPLLRRVPEPPKAPAPPGMSGNAFTQPFISLGHTLRELVTTYRQTLLMIVAFFIYNDGIVTIITMAAPYGAELGFRPNVMITSLLVVQFVGIPFAFAFGLLADRIGTKPSILIGLAAYAGITIYGFFMRTETQFIVLSLLVGTVQGGTQALSRSMFARMVPRHKSGEFFGFFSVFNRFGGIMGTGVFALMALLVNQSRYAILSLITFFIVGAILLWFVDVEKGERAARANEPAPVPTDPQPIPPIASAPATLPPAP